MGPATFHEQDYNVGCLFVIGIPFFFQGFYLLYKGYKRLKESSKPVYGEEPVYKSDRRYKSGYRADGYRTVITGHEPMSEGEIALSKAMARTRFIWGGIFIAIGTAFLIWGIDSGA